MLLTNNSSAICCVCVYPVGHRRAADLTAMALENTFKAVQRQGVGVLGYQDPGQQLHAGQAFAQRVCRPWRGLDLLSAVFGIENGFFLPVLDHPGLRRNDVQLFLDLAEEGFIGPGRNYSPLSA